jgi:Methane oxygenase PmoA
MKTKLARMVIVLGALVGAAHCLKAQVEFKTGEDHIAISIDGKPFSDFYIGSTYPKPYLAPLRTASGVIVTRKFPMENVAGESRDHPHHRGLWIGFHEISGVNFWENEFTYTTNNRGKIVLRKVDEVKPGKKSGSITADFAWVDMKGAEMFDEHRTMRFAGTLVGDSNVRVIDVDVTLTAKMPAKFTDDKDGFFAIRVADSMAEKNGGVMTNSHGAEGEKNVWGRRADWVDYRGSVDGTKVGIAMFDNPANYNHPPRWHSRGYGLFAVNPFLSKGTEAGPEEHGGYDMAAGSSLRFRYRVIIHGGDVPMKEIGDWYSEYAAKGK